MPAVFIDEYPSAGYTNIGTDPYGNYRLGQDTGQLSATLNKVHGKHDLKFGFDGRIHQIKLHSDQRPNGFFSFNRDGSYMCPGDRNGHTTDDPNLPGCGGDSMASFMMAQITQGDAAGRT